MIFPADLAGCCPAASERRAPALARARAARITGRPRASRMALTAHLVLRRVTDGWHGAIISDATLARLRNALDAPGSAADEAVHLLRILGAIAPIVDAAALTRALTDYAIHLEGEGLGTEALFVLGRLLRGAPAFASPLERVDLALLIARLNVALARWEEADRALDRIERIDGLAPELYRLAHLTRATAWVGQGRLAAALDQLASLESPSEAEARLGPAWLALGAALEVQGLPLEALRAYQRALVHAVPGTVRRRVLAALGELLRGLGAGSAARQAFTLALAGPIPFADQIAARIELLELAGSLGDRVAFERQRRELAACQDQLPPAAAIEYLTHAASGFEAFGQPSRAGRLLVEAQEMAERHELHEAWFRLERMITRNRRGTYGALRPAAHIALPWEHPEIAEVAQALERQAAILAGSA